MNLGPLVGEYLGLAKLATKEWHEVCKFLWDKVPFIAVV